MVSEERHELKDLLGLPFVERDGKPRSRGLTGISDNSLPYTVMEGYLEEYGRYIDTVKLNTGHNFEPVEVLTRKNELLASHQIPVQPSGTYLEIARTLGKERETLETLRDVGFTRVEVSASTSPAEMEEQVAFADLARSYGLEVVGEVGMKWPEGDPTRIKPDEIDVDQTVAHMQAYLDAGIEKFYWEGHILRRVIGQTPEDMERRLHSARNQILGVVAEIPHVHIMFETTALLPTPARRLMALWYWWHFGPEVNLANFHFEDVAGIECIRRGIAPITGLGRVGDHPWIRRLAESGGKPPRGEWWLEADR